MLTTWLIELFLNELGGLRDEGDATGHHKLQQQFHKFLEIDALRVSQQHLIDSHDSLNKKFSGA